MMRYLWNRMRGVPDPRFEEQHCAEREGEDDRKRELSRREQEARRTINALEDLANILTEHKHP